jgi:signal transduction histidine kinase
LTGLALELDVARREAADHSDLAQRFGQTAANARDLANRMREVVWTINPRCDTVAGLASFLDQMASQFLQTAGLKVRIEFPEYIPALPLSGDARHQLALAVREALTNVVRHAGASQVALSLKINQHELFLQIQDNGRGFQADEATGRGLANMRVRLEQIGGRFGYASTLGLGTTIIFRLPLAPDSPG